MKRLFVLLIAGLGTFTTQSQTIVDTTKVEALDEVLVKSVRVDADSPITHSNLSKEEIASRNLGQDIPILLNYLPGVVTNSDAGAGVGYTGIRVRGSDASRVNVTLNGIPFNDAESQGTFWVNLPDFASSVENLQLQRGVGTSTNGSGAFGASLNILTDAVSEKANGEFANSFGSFNTRKHTLKFSTGLLNDHWEIAGRLSNITSDGYVDRATSDLKSYFLQAAYVGDNTLVKALAFGGRELTYQAYFGIDRETLETNRTFNPVGQFTDDDGNIQFYDNEVDDYAQDHYQIHWNQRFDNNWSTTLSVNYTYGRGFFEQYREDEDFATYGFEPIELGGEVINTTDLVRRRWLDNDYYVLNTSVNYKDNNVDIVGGLFYSYYGGDHFGEVIWAQNAGGSQIRDRYYFGTGTKNEFTTFAKATYRIDDQWAVFADLQGRFIDYTADGTTSDLIELDVKDNFSFFNPKAGASYKINTKNQLYASYGRANREPRRADYENGVTTAETLDDFELGWRHTATKNSFSANAYFMNYRNQLVLTGALDDVGQPIRATSGKSYRLGLEVEANLQLAPKLNWRPNVALSSNKNQDFTTSRDGELVNLGTTNISYSPELIAGSILTYSPQKDVQISFLSKYVSEQYMGNIDSEASILDSFFVNDLNLTYSWETAPLVERIVFSGLVNNIFNVEYVPNGYFFTFDDDFSNPGTVTTIEGAGFFPQATINFLVGASIQF